MLHCDIISKQNVSVYSGKSKEELKEPRILLSDISHTWKCTHLPQATMVSCEETPLALHQNVFLENKDIIGQGNSQIIPLWPLIMASYFSHAKYASKKLITNPNVVNHKNSLTTYPLGSQSWFAMPKAKEEKETAPSADKCHSTCGEPTGLYICLLTTSSPPI